MNEFNATGLEALIKIPLRTVFHFTRNGETLGFLFAEEINKDTGTTTFFTPFTSDGLLVPTQCLKCALKSLIKLHEGSGELIPCDRLRTSVGIEIHVISLERKLH